jgi:hypothetical protein
MHNDEGAKEKCGKRMSGESPFHYYVIECHTRLEVIARSRSSEALFPF